MERMKIEIEKSEYDRLKSREEKLMAYYEWFVDKENDLATVEDIITENIELKEKLSEITMVADDEKQSIEHILELEEENKKLKEAIKELNNYNKFWIQENEKLKEKLNGAGLEEYGFFNEH